MLILKRLFGPPSRDLAYIKALHQDTAFQLHLMEQQGVASGNPIYVRWQLRMEVLEEILGIAKDSGKDTVVKLSQEWLVGNMVLAERAEGLKEIGTDILNSPRDLPAEFARGVKTTWAIVVRYIETGEWDGEITE